MACNCKFCTVLERIRKDTAFKTPTRAHPVVYRTAGDNAHATVTRAYGGSYSYVALRTSGQTLRMEMPSGVSWDEAMRALEKAAEQLSDDERKGYAKKAVKAVQNGYAASAAKAKTATVAGSTQAMKNAYSPTAVKANGDPPTQPSMKAALPEAYVLSKPSHPAPKASSGVSCKRCNSKNDFAEPNQPDGSYLCFECR